MEKLARKNPTSPGGFSSDVQLCIRPEIFEHGVFPSMSHGKITSSILIDTFTNLNLLSTIDYKIKLQNWVDQAVKHIPGMSENDATIYFLTYKNLLQDVDSQTSG